MELGRLMIARNPKDVGLLMREQRRRLGLDQGELARRARVSRQWVIEVEQGKARAEVGLVLRALGVLGLTLDIQEARQRVAQDGARLPIDLDAVIERARAERGGVTEVARLGSGPSSQKKPSKRKKARPR
jgi:HTH-type transcriptional regulator/antitoxin HipB